MNDEVLRHLIHERQYEREREAKEERLAAQARRQRPSRESGKAPTAGLWLLLTARRHATH